MEASDNELNTWEQNLLDTQIKKGIEERDRSVKKYLIPLKALSIIERKPLKRACYRLLNKSIICIHVLKRTMRY